MSPTSTRNDSYGIPVDDANAFGLADVDNDVSQLSPQMLESYYVTGQEVATLFRKYISLLLYYPYLTLIGLQRTIYLTCLF